MRVWNVGPGEGAEIGVKTIKRRDFDGKVKEYVRVPPPFSGCVCAPNGSTGKIDWDGVCRCGREDYREHKPGNVYLAMPGYQFYTIPRGESFDIPPGMSLKAVQNACPHLIAQEDYEAQQQASEGAAPAVLADAPKAEKQQKKTNPSG